MDRGKIMTAFGNLVFAAAPFKTKGRRLLRPSEMQGYPAIFVANIADDYVRRENQPPRVTMNVAIFLYSDAGTNPNAAPIEELQRLVDAVEAAIAIRAGTDLVNNRQTLGGLVHHAWIEGAVDFYPADYEKQSKAIVPVKILVP